MIYLWNGKVGVNAQTLPFPFALKLLHNSKVCTQATCLQELKAEFHDENFLSKKPYEAEFSKSTYVMC